MTSAPELRVFTYRKGMLAAIGHDLQLSLRRFSLELDASRLTGRFDLKSLRVDGAINRGRLEPHALTPQQKAEIEQTIARQILHVETHSEALLTGAVTQSDGSPLRVSGLLSLHGRSQAFDAEVEASQRLLGSAELVPSRWGIPPYKALGGMLKLEDRVRVEIALPADVPGFELARWGGARCFWSSE